MGPQGFQDHHQVYLRTAISVDPAGLGALRLREAARLPLGHLPRRADARSQDRLRRFHRPAGLAGSAGRVPQPAAPPDRHPGRHRAGERRAAALLGAHCPSLYDLRNLFQVNVEEGRHLWAMVYLLHSYFGRDGRDEAEELLERQSGNPDKPRILDAFNEPIENWLDFFMFTMFTDRDGKSQLLSLSESSLDPLSRTTRFMLTEEAHHMFVGETGIARILERTCQLMKEAGFSGDVRKLGGIDLAADPEVHQPLVQPEPRPARQRGLDQRGRLLRQRPQGPRRRRQVRRRPRARPATSTCSTARRERPHQPAGSPDAQRDERGAARLVRRRLPGRRRPLEQADPRSARHVGSHPACRRASSTAASACTPACTSIRRASR